MLALITTDLGFLFHPILHHQAYAEHRRFSIYTMKHD